ncbi:TonB-dependent receptor [Chryseosolibacter indicus]|uniref:TonB-dependent receptor n=1 Tax=Chryseosolibacter indicus TaxID=2782351 RepID=A0ABS5VUQ9_9BACT|nr:TonB-dependent receptor [Chryseosolibacter indicus]MBT1705167.1 TonB-dependent receptor [Chryseosolibacter indicus]
MKKELKVHGQLLFIMRISLLQILFAGIVFSVAHATELDAQVLDRKFSVKSEEISLRLALQKIGRATDTKFMYESQLIPTSIKVNLEVNNERLSDVLQRLLEPYHIQFEAEGHQIILTRKQSAQSDASSFDDSMALLSITGTVRDELGQPLPGVNVMVKGTTNGITTDGDGKYAINVSDQNAILVFSFIGYVTQEVSVGAQTQIDIAMTPDVTSLDEVVVVGYGEVKKSDLTGSVASVNNNELNAFPVVNAMQGLSGRAAGVQVIQSSGAPGAGLSMRIRGGNSMLGSNEPLYVIDGFAISGSPTHLNPADIESLEILKDASATAIYGSRGANGVVLITTKGGKKGTSQVAFDTYVGFQQVIKKVDMLNATEFALLANERAKNDDIAPYFTNEQIASFGEGTDWQDEIFRTAPIQNHVLTFSGGTDKSLYSVSGSFFQQDGVIIGSDYTRGSLRANFSQNISDKFKVAYTSILTRSVGNTLSNDNASRGDGVVSAALTAPPTVPAKDVNGKYSNVTPYPFSSNAAENPVALALERLNRSTRSSALMNLSLSYEFIEGLTLRVSGGADYANTRNDYYSPSIFKLTPSGNAYNSFEDRVTYLNENILTYTKTVFDTHVLGLTGGFTYQSEAYKFNSSGASGFPNDQLLNNNLQSGTVISPPNSSVSEWTLMSWLGRANYSINDKYLITASMRADGSSRFGDANKWGYFPSAAVAWRISEEDFIKNIGAVSNLKLRASWGQTGNTAISPYQTLNTLNSAPIVLNDNLYTGYAPGQTKPNQDLRWETTTQTDIGVDVGFFNERITLTADYYIKNTTDLLATVPLPTSSGYINETRNIGEIRNSGIELTLGADILRSDFKWNASANFSANRNEAVKLAGGSDVFSSASLSVPLSVSVNIVREGSPVGAFFGYVEDGLDAQGNIKYKDVTPDGVLNNLDRTIIGDPNPDFIYGFNNNFSFKNFTLNVFFQGVQGNDIFNFNLANHADGFNFGENQVRDILNHWTPENPNPNAPNPRISVNTKFRESDRFIEDGSFLRLKNVKLGYNLPVTNLKLNWLKSAHIYASAQNLLTLTGYSWYDPEVSTRITQSSIALGIDQTSYPNARTYTFGLNLVF